MDNILLTNTLQNFSGFSDMAIFLLKPAFLTKKENEANMEYF